jgi:phosphodiesterase/alkaline phosphatase D-like protein
MTIYGTDDRINARTCVANCGGDWNTILPLVFNETDKRVYDDRSSPLNARLDETLTAVVDIQTNESNTLFAESDLQRMQSTFLKSKNEGVTWQIMLSQIIFSPQQIPDYYSAVQLYPDYAPMATFILDLVFQLNDVNPPSYPNAINDPGMIFRGSYASLMRGIPISGDQWDGYSYQRRKMMQMFAESTNNIVVLSGDSHNAWAYEFGVDGQPVGVEFAAASIPSAGYETGTLSLSPSFLFFPFSSPFTSIISPPSLLQLFSHFFFSY